VKSDRGDTNDLKDREPELFIEMLTLWEVYRKDVGIVGLAGEYPRPTPGGRWLSTNFWICMLGSSMLVDLIIRRRD
jgi:hypothetical protein